MDPETAETVPPIPKGTIDAPRFTKRELEVLHLIAEGASTKEIASALGITFKTAATHRGQIMKKLGVHTVVHVVRYAIRAGMIQA